MITTASPPPLHEAVDRLHLARFAAAGLSFASVAAADGLRLPWLHAVAIWATALVVWICAELRFGDAHREPGGADAASFAAAAALFALSFFWMAWFAQPITWLNGGLAWDGRNYLAMYGGFKGFPAHVAAPYGQRVGLPMLATFLPFAASTNFGFLAGGFWVGAGALLAHCLRTHFRLSAPAALAVFAWAHLMFISPARAAHYAPFTVEAPATFFLIAFLFMAHTRKVSRDGAFALCVCVGFAAAFFKETAVLLAGLGLASHLLIVAHSRVRAGQGDGATSAPNLAPSRSWRIWLIAARRSATDPSVLPWAGLLLGALGGWLLAQIPLGFASGASNIAVMGTWLADRLGHPSSFVRMITAYALALAPFAILFVAQQTARVCAPRLGLGSGPTGPGCPAASECCAMNVRPPRRQARPESPVANDRALWLMLGLYALVSSVSGSDLTRFAFFALPFAAPLALRAATNMGSAHLLAAWALSAPLARICEVIPSPDITTDPFRRGNDAHGLYSWFAEYATMGLVCQALGYVVACGIILGVARVWQAKRAGRGN